MRRSIAVPVILSLAFAAQANDGGEVSLRTKALVSAVSVSAVSPSAISSARHSEAPFVAGHDPLPQILLQEEQERLGVRSACETTARDFCYDLTERRVVYRGAREYMPSMPGLSPEGVTVRHNRIALKYSFR